MKLADAALNGFCEQVRDLCGRGLEQKIWLSCLKQHATSEHAQECNQLPAVKWCLLRGKAFCHGFCFVGVGPSVFKIRQRPARVRHKINGAQFQANLLSQCLHSARAGPERV